MITSNCSCTQKLSNSRIGKESNSLPLIYFHLHKTRPSATSSNSTSALHPMTTHPCIKRNHPLHFLVHFSAMSDFFPSCPTQPRGERGIHNRCSENSHKAYKLKWHSGHFNTTYYSQHRQDLQIMSLQPWKRVLPRNTLRPFCLRIHFRHP